MLVLTRKLAEKIVISGGITITVVRLEGHQVRIGIEAPSDIGVLRAELLDPTESTLINPPKTAPLKRRMSTGQKR